MTPDANADLLDLEARIDAYEQAQRSQGEADLANFLPPPDHAQYGETLRELIRVDMEYAWSRGRPLYLEDYHRRFPALSHDPAALRDVAFEEYRLRLQAGENPSLGE